MSTANTPGEGLPRDAANWAKDGSSLKVSYVPNGVANINVEGRQALSPLQGFGQMWQKTYKIRLEGADVTPADVIKAWKENFTTFWPKGNRFYAPLTGIAPGEVAIINMSLGGMPLSTGVMILYADDVSFTVMTPEGHVFAGWNTFSSHEEDGCTVAQVQVLIRANDPIYEIGFRLGASKMEDNFWIHTVKGVAAHFGVTDAPVAFQRVCVDPRLQWAYAKNIWYNAGVRTTLHIITTPLRWLQKRK